jgi:hypothetical protein
MAYGDDFIVYGPYQKDNGRKLVIVVDKNGVRRTVSYPKWLMELHLGRKLDINETVDHWDSNIDNNNLENLRVVPRAEHSANDTRRVKLVDFNCAWCNKEFKRSPRLIRDKAKKKKSGPFCSRSCAGKYSRQLQLKLIKRFSPQKPISSEYYKRKYVTASIDFDINTIDIDFEELISFASNEFLYHETNSSNIDSIIKFGLKPTSYGQSLVNDITHEVMSPEEIRDSIIEELEYDFEGSSDEDFDRIVEEEFNSRVDPDDLVPRTYVLTEMPKANKYGDILLRFPLENVTGVYKDVDPFIYDEISASDIDIFINGEWKKLI